MKKTLRLFLLILLSLILFSTNIFAITLTSDKVEMQLVENNVCKIQITDYAEFEKKLIEYDLDNKELKIQLKVSNNAVLPLDKPSEIILLIDDSLSMDNTISTGGTRMEAVTNSAKLLATELLKLDTVKLGVVSFSSIGDKVQPDGSVSNIDEGKITDATLRTELTRDESSIINAINEISAIGARTNIEAGLELAKQQFTGTCESQYIILLTDGVPNLGLGSNSIQYSLTVVNNTKKALKDLDASGIHILSMMTGVTESLEILLHEIRGEECPHTNDIQTNAKEVAQMVFGTPNNPTAGKFFYITDDEIEETISGEILNQLIAPKDDFLTDIDVYDYFPQEIIDNFNFEYIEEPSVGTVSEDIDLQNNCIVWHIDELGYNSSASLVYKLTLKEDIPSEIVDIIIKTNDKVDITTDNVLDNEGNKKTLTSDVSPKVKLVAVVDETPAPIPIPQTGMTIAMFTALVTLLSICAILGITIYTKNKQKTW